MVISVEGVNTAQTHVHTHAHSHTCSLIPVFKDLSCERENLKYIYAMVINCQYSTLTSKGAPRGGEGCKVAALPTPQTKHIL
jgi:hypothetical protein